MVEASAKEGQGQMSKFHQVSYDTVHEIRDIPGEVEIHCMPSPEFTKRFGKRVKAAGGHYSECRGHRSYRYVHIPCEGNEALIGEVVSVFGCGRSQRGRGPAGVTMIARKTGLRSSQAWMEVHYITREGEGEIFDRFLAAYHAGLKNAADRDHISGVYEGSVPQEYAEYQAAQKWWAQISKDVPQAEAALVEVALAFGRGELRMADLAESIADCQRMRTERSDAATALETAKVALESVYAQGQAA